MDDMNQIIGKEIAVAKACYMDDEKSGYAFKEALTVDPIVMELNAVSMESLQDCVKQLEKMGSWDEVAKEQGYHDEGHKMTGLVITSSLDPRVCMSVEFGRRWNKDSDQQQLKTGEKDVTLKWFLNDEHKDQYGVKGTQAERGATPEELDIISKIREATKLSSKVESRQPVMTAIKKGYRMLSESKMDDRAAKLLAVFDKKVGIEKAVASKIGEVQVGDVSWRYGGREVSASTPDGLTFIWDVNTIGDRHSYMLFDIQDENGKSVSEAKKMSEDEMAKPIEREVTITLTLKQAAEALGYGDWAKMNDYLDADDQEDVWHSGYSAKDAVNFSDPDGLDGATKVFPEQVAMAAESAERYGLAAAITKERHDVICQAFEKIEPTGEYQSGDGEMISVRGCGIKSCAVDAPTEEVVLVIRNPEHLINDLVAGMGLFATEIDPYVAASDEEIKSGIMSVAGDYFEIYGERKPEVSDRIDGGVDDSVYSEEAKYRISEMSAEEVAEAVIDAADSERVDSEREGIEIAAKLTGMSKAEISKAVKASHAGSAEKYQKRAASVPEESVKRSGKKLSESKEKGAVMKKIQEGVFNDWDAVDFFGLPKMEADYKPEFKAAQAPHVAPVAKKDKEVEKKVSELKGDGEPNKAGEPIAKPASELSVGVKSGQAPHKEADIKVGDAEDGRGEVVHGKGKSDMQQKALPAKAVKVGDAEDGHGEVMADSRRVSGRPMSEAMKARLVEWRKKKMAEKMGHKKMSEKMGHKKMAEKMGMKKAHAKK